MNTESRISRREFVKGSVAAALGSTAVAMAGCSNAVQPEHQFASGTYTGSAMGRAGEIAVEISVKNDCITKATLISNGDTAVISERAAEKILGDIVEYQTLEVDTVSGASLTSMAVISAAEQALEQAGDPAPFQSPAAYPARECEDCATDVVVVGAGSAGMNAAIRLADAGANVILVEKQGFLGGGDTMFASSGLAGGGGYTVYRNGVADSSEQDYLNTKLKSAEKSGLPVDVDCLTAYALRSGDAVDAYISMGVPFGKFAKFSNTIIDGSSPGVHIIKRLAEQVNERHRLPPEHEAGIGDAGGRRGHRRSGGEPRRRVRHRGRRSSPGVWRLRKQRGYAYRVRRCRLLLRAAPFGLRLGHR